MEAAISTPAIPARRVGPTLRTRRPARIADIGTLIAADDRALCRRASRTKRRLLTVSSRRPGGNLSYPLAMIRLIRVCAGALLVAGSISILTAQSVYPTGTT